MKLITPLLLLFTSICFSQVYQVNQSIILENSNKNLSFETINKDSIQTTVSTTIIKNQFLEKVGEFGDDLFLKQKNENDETIYKISKSKAKEVLDEAKGKWGFGIMTLPIKIRFEGGSESKGNKRYFDFEGGFNLGLAITRQFGSEYTSEIKKYFVFSINTSQVKVSDETTNGFETSEKSIMAFSPTGGFVFQFKNDLQLITVMGIDYLSGKVGTKWVYRDKPFVGIGIGFSAFQFGKKE